MLYRLKSKLNQKIDDAVKEVAIGYKFCPKCMEYYKEKTWDTDYKIEKRSICVNRDAGYGDDDRYENKTCSVGYDICPMGHAIEKAGSKVVIE